MILLYVPAADAEAAGRIARALLEERLIACANLVPVRSLYRWEGEVREEPEVLLLMKTRRELYAAAAARLRQLHDYALPCLAAYPAEAVNEDYLAWVRSETRGEGA